MNTEVKSVHSNEDGVMNSTFECLIQETFGDPSFESPDAQMFNILDQERSNIPTNTYFDIPVDVGDQNNNAIDVSHDPLQIWPAEIDLRSFLSVGEIEDLLRPVDQPISTQGNQQEIPEIDNGTSLEQEQQNDAEGEIIYVETAEDGSAKLSFPMGWLERLDVISSGDEPTEPIPPPPEGGPSNPQEAVEIPASSHPLDLRHSDQDASREGTAIGYRNEMTPFKNSQNTNRRHSRSLLKVNQTHYSDDHCSTKKKKGCDGTPTASHKVKVNYPKPVEIAVILDQVTKTNGSSQISHLAKVHPCWMCCYRFSCPSQLLYHLSYKHFGGAFRTLFERGGGKCYLCDRVLNSACLYAFHVGGHHRRVLRLVSEEHRTRLQGILGKQRSWRGRARKAQ